MGAGVCGGDIVEPNPSRDQAVQAATCRDSPPYPWTDSSA